MIVTPQIAELRLLFLQYISLDKLSSLLGEIERTGVYASKKSFHDTVNSLQESLQVESLLGRRNHP